jgi:V8-like Glu-specific endopeptidase
MPEKVDPQEAKPENLHTSVSNQSERPADTEAAKLKPVSQPPSDGKDSESNKVSNDMEEIEGRSYRESMATGEALGAMFTAPTSAKLRDIAEASFGEPPPRAETVHGPDDRVKIANTTIIPWRMNASLLITARDNSTWIGTGWFVGPHTLVTAGHVVFIKNSGVPGRDGWVRSIQVMPGRNGAALPFGSVTSTNFRSVTGWTNNGDQNFDYGAIITPTNIGNTVGWYGFGVYSDADLRAATANISGYPGDKPSGTQWYDSRRVASVNSRKVFYDIDTAGGQSGSAVYRIINGARFGIAIHAYGGATTNSGTRIVSDVFNNIVGWKA